MNNRALGKAGEELAASLLKLNGYRILKRNYYCRYGEIDIIAVKNGIVVFCEVKTRTDDSFGTGRESVNREKIKHLVKSAESYLAYTGIEYKYAEFEVIEININRIKNIRI